VEGYEDGGDRDSWRERQGIGEIKSGGNENGRKRIWRGNGRIGHLQNDRLDLTMIPSQSNCEKKDLCSVVVRPHRINSYMRPFATDGIAWSVYVSVCLSVTFASPVRLNRSRCYNWRLDSHKPKETCLRCGSRSLYKTVESWWLSGPLKTLWVSAAVYAAKGIVQSSITTQHAMRPFVELLRPLVNCTIKPMR